ncbi:hypothetical protein A458_12460 [Stutzerimonas stutzeri CCUG 29243]|uniref:Uncharacterized protein n=1 Tax=Stutzerimonas stutzeri CCUG 29243 TaxID=1196835 RepID=I4CUH0_STUST|nr:hypothetical protein A458_12460 [Stutzerimonas stutzeri CCUG 29243]
MYHLVAAIYRMSGVRMQTQQRNIGWRVRLKHKICVESTAKHLFREIDTFRKHAELMANRSHPV